jgi:hypothetical protein
MLSVSADINTPWCLHITARKALGSGWARGSVCYRSRFRAMNRIYCAIVAQRIARCPPKAEVEDSSPSSRRCYRSDQADYLSYRLCHSLGSLISGENRMFYKSSSL